MKNFLEKNNIKTEKDLPCHECICISMCVHKFWATRIMECTIFNKYIRVNIMPKQKRGTYRESFIFLLDHGMISHKHNI
jgi:hypothetical protein